MKLPAALAILVLGLLAGFLAVSTGLVPLRPAAEAPPRDQAAAAPAPPAAAESAGVAPEAAAGAREAKATEAVVSPASDSVPSPPTGSGERALDAWHRALPAAREAVAGEMKAAEARELRDFARIWKGEGSAYAAALRLGPPSALGKEFAAYAAAFASGEAEALERALAAARTRGPAWLAWEDALARRALEAGDYGRAGRSLGEALRGMAAAGYGREAILELGPLVAQVAAHAAAFVPWREHVVQSGESFDPIARSLRRGGTLVHYGWLADFNGKRRSDGTRNYTLRAGERLKIPTVALRIEVWRQLRLTVVFAGEAPVRLYPVSVGQPGHETPVGEFVVGKHEKEPVWWVQGHEALPYGHPDNPLGSRWLGFQEPSEYGFHGTNNGDSIGSFETQGCIRMRNADVEDLYDLIPDGTTVTIRS